MKTPLSVRVVSIVILIVTLIGFGVLGVIGITGVRTALSVNVGNVTTQVVGPAESIAIPISLINPGPLSLNGIDVAIVFLDPNGTLLSTGGGGPLSLPPGSSGQLPISVLFDLDEVPQAALARLATTSENLTLSASLSASVSSLTSFKATIDIPYSWGAPISDLQLGTLTTTPYNATSAKFSVPLSFTDASQTFGVSGNVTGTLFGQSGSVIGTIASQAINVGTGDSFSGELSGYISQASQNPVTAQLVFQTNFGTFAMIEYA